MNIDMAAIGGITALLTLFIAAQKVGLLKPWQQKKEKSDSASAGERLAKLEWQHQQHGERLGRIENKLDDLVEITQEVRISLASLPCGIDDLTGNCKGRNPR